MCGAAQILLGEETILKEWKKTTKAQEPFKIENLNNHHQKIQDSAYY